MKKNNHKTTVELVSLALTKMEQQAYYTPEQLQTIYLKELILMLAALDDDMKELISTLKRGMLNENDCNKDGDEDNA